MSDESQTHHSSLITHHSLIPSPPGQSCDGNLADLIAVLLGKPDGTVRLDMDVLRSGVGRWDRKVHDGGGTGRQHADLVAVKLRKPYIACRIHGDPRGRGVGCWNRELLPG